MRHKILARTNVFDASEKEVSKSNGNNVSSGRNNFNKSSNSKTTTTTNISSTKPFTFTTSSPRTTKHSLHSKSTYFYNKWFSGKNKNSSNRKENRNSKNSNSIKKGSPSLYSTSSTSSNSLFSLTSSSFFSYSIPIACSIALLGGLSMAVNPIIDRSIGTVYVAVEIFLCLVGHEHEVLRLFVEQFYERCH